MTSPSQTLHSALASLLSRQKPLTIAPEAAIRDAVVSMAEARADCIVVVEPESKRPIGIFTVRDLLRRVAATGGDLDQMILSATTDSDLQMLNWRATAYQAALVMARQGIHHVLVVDASERLIGVVSQDDIYELQHGGGKAISGAIRTAREMESLIAAAEDIRQLAMRSLAEGAAAEPLTQLISSLNDHLTVRVIELTRAEFDLPAVTWSWLSFGSEGRFEQTLATDQDNGLLFVAGTESADVLRERFLPFARKVNERLAECGFPLCRGNVMASNPELCLSQEEWRGRFGSWIQSNNPQSLLNATIYFDFRTLYGAEAPVEELRSWLLANIPSANLFLRFMATNALQVDPPLAIIGDFKVERSGDYPHTLDLKTRGARLFVDAARVLALANGVGATGTAERLRELSDRGKLGRDDVGALIQGFFALQQLRLRLQQSGTAAGQANRVNPDELNEFDRLILKEAFKQAKKLQGRLQLEYRL